MTTSKKKVQKVIEMFQNGSKIQHIADDLKLARNTVKNILRRNGLLPYSYAKNPQYGPPSPFDYYKDSTYQEQQLNDSLGASLTHELDEKNQENEKLKQEIIKHKTENESMKLEIEKLQKTVNEQIVKVETMSQENQRNFNGLKDIYNEQLKKYKQGNNEELEIIKKVHKRDLERKDKDHEYELEKQKNNHDKQIKKIEQDHKRELEQKDNIIAVKEKKIEEDQETIKNTVSKALERIKSLNNEILVLKKEENVSYRDGFICGLLLGGTGGSLVTLFIQKLLSPTSNTNQTNNVYPRKARPVINAFPIPPEMLTQSEIDYTNSGVNPVTNISGTTCSGTLNNNYGEIHNTRCNATINQQDAEIIDNPETSNEYNLSINASIDPCLGGYFSDGENNTVSGHIIFSDQQEKQTQPDINNRYNPEIYTYDCSYSGLNYVNYNGYIDYRPELKKVTYVNPTPQIEHNTYIPNLPIPIDYHLPYTTKCQHKTNLKSNISQFLANDKTGTRFEDILEKFFIHIGGKVIRTPKTNDKGADLIVYLKNDVIIIQAKDRQDKITITGVQEVHGARSYYDNPKPNRAIVITTSEFTKQAIDYAEKLGVECWDYEKLLDEMIDSQFYL